MTTQDIASLGPALARFLESFACCFVKRPSFKHFLAYCRGLLGDLPRKSVEPIALAADLSVRTLQEFLSDHVWQHDRMRDLLQQRIAQRHMPTPGTPRAADDLGTIGILDETSHPKKGDKTPGVQPQHCGATGKLDNCIVTVHLAYAWQKFHALIDRDLFLPEGWADDRQRCRDAYIPDDMGHQPKWKIGLGQIQRALANGIRFDWLTFDEEYGKVPEFLFALDGMGQTFIGEVPNIFLAWARKPKYRSLRKEYAPSFVRNLARWSDPFIYAPWQDVWLQRQTLAPQRWRVKAARVYLVRGKRDKRTPTDRTYWLIHAWQPDTDEHKYFICNAPINTPVAVMMRAAFQRARIEHLFRIAKSQVGLSHFEGRSYVGLMRHLTLCQLMLLFLAEQTDRLRGEKPAGHDRAGCSGLEQLVSALA